MVSIKDVANKTGLSPSTISLVLNNHSKIPETTKKRVLKAIAELGYVPHYSARSLSSKQTYTIAVIVPQISHIFSIPFFGEAISGIYDACYSKNYKLIFEQAKWEWAAAKNYLRIFKERRIDGMIYIGSTTRDKYLKDFEKEDYKIILVGSYFEDIDLSYVIGDNFQGARQATEYLIGLGHKRIGLITGGFQIISARDRYRGYRKALEIGGIPFNSSLVERADFDFDSGYEAMKRLLPKKPTAVFAGNDLMALGAIQAVEDAGLKVPDDISICGMDNIRTGRLLDNKLTTVDYNVYNMGFIAANRLIEMLESNRKEKIKEIISTKLIIRESCKKVG